MTRLFAGRAGFITAAIVALWGWDAILFKHDRPWAAWLPLGLGGLFVMAWMGRWSRTRLTGLALALGLVALFHLGFERASGDGREYFAQLHSWVFDWDVDYANEARDFGARIPDVYPIGSAILWLPFYLAAHAWLLLLGVFGADVRPDGYGPPYQMAIGLGTVAYGVAGLAMAWRVAANYVSRGVALGATVAVTAGSFLIWYLTIDASWAHGTSMFAVTLFLYVWHRSRTNRPVRQWLLLGAAAGLMTLVRWQNAMFVLVPAAEAVGLALRALPGSDRVRLSSLLGGVAAAAATGAVVFVPQLYVWKATNGGWFSPPQGQAGQMWWGDSLMADVLFSSNHGLFAWHPLLYVATLGLLLFARRDRTLAGLLALCFVVATYLNGAVSTWWGGSAFGGRRFDGLTLAFVLGLAAVIETGLRRPALVMSVLVAGFVGANALLVSGVSSGALPMGEGVPASQMAGVAYRRLGNPFSFPANAWFAWQSGGTAADYDRLGRRLYSNLRIDFGDPGDDEFLIAGWSGREDDPEGSFRWSSGAWSGLAVPLLGTRVLAPGQVPAMPDYRLTLRAAPFDVITQPLQRVRVEVNGATVAEMDLASGYADYTLEVPGHHLGRGLNRIVFRYGYALSPSASGLGEDDRVLAARFDWLTLEQVTGR